MVCDYFVTHPSQFVIHSYPTIQCYIEKVSLSKPTINQTSSQALSMFLHNILNSISLSASSALQCFVQHVPTAL